MNLEKTLWRERGRAECIGIRLTATAASAFPGVREGYESVTGMLWSHDMDIDNNPAWSARQLVQAGATLDAMESEVEA